MYGIVQKTFAIHSSLHGFFNDFMDLSIVIPSYNTKALLGRCLTSIYASLTNESLMYEVIVVDNASSDGSSSLVRNKFPQTTLLLNKKNLGYGKANNQAIKKARGKYILLLNSDIIVQNRAIGALYRFIKKQNAIFAGGKLFNEDGSPQSSCGPFYTLPVVALMLFTRGDHWGATRWSPNETRPVDWVSGACLIGAKSSFLDVGLFDENIFMYMDEVEFLYRARKQGYLTYFCHDAQFVHTGAASSGSRKTPVTNIYRGLLYFYKKHRDPFSLAMLRIILTSKALAAILLGRMIRRRDLVQTYEEALAVLG